MSYTESPTIQLEPAQLDVPSDHAPDYASDNPIGCRRALVDCLRIVGHELASEKGSADVERTQRTLDEVAGMVRSDGTIATRRDYERFLQRLTRIYGEGCEQRDNAAFATTAAGYAAVIEAVSRTHPELDYTSPLGQLLEFMTRLFAARNNSWKLVYKHLRAVPDSVKAKQTLNRVCSAGIREWFDAGVQNLFSLRDDLEARIDEFAATAERIDRKILVTDNALTEARRRVDPEGKGKVVMLNGRIKEREILALEIEKEEVLEQIEGRKNTLGLIESDIREFENILREARRAYYIRVV